MLGERWATDQEESDDRDTEQEQDGACRDSCDRLRTGEQGESGLGLKAQVAAIQAACELRGWELVAIREEVKSGARADNRPVLTDVIRAEPSQLRKQAILKHIDIHADRKVAVNE